LVLDVLERRTEKRAADGILRAVEHLHVVVRRRDEKDVAGAQLEPLLLPFALQDSLWLRRGFPRSGYELRCLHLLVHLDCFCGVLPVEPHLFDEDDGCHRKESYGGSDTEHVDKWPAARGLIVEGLHQPEISGADAENDEDQEEDFFPALPMFLGEGARHQSREHHLADAAYEESEQTEEQWM
jgi:hypothetical protein